MHRSFAAKDAAQDDKVFGLLVGNIRYRLGEGILDPQVFNLPSVLEVFAVELLASAFQSRRDDQRVIPRQSVFLRDSQCFEIDRGRRMDGEHWTEHGDQVLFRLRHAHGLREPPQSHAKELLHDLVADDALTGVGSAACQCWNFRTAQPTFSCS